MRTTGSLAAVLAATTLATAVAAAQNGNGAPNGSHYTLNIIGVPRDKSSNPNWTSGHVIFVNLGSKSVTVTTKILLSQSTESGVFDVLDKNGTDGEASFSLPAPGTYTVFAWKSVPPTAWQNAEFLSSYLDRGHVINITLDSRATLELESIP